METTTTHLKNQGLEFGVDIAGRGRGKHVSKPHNSKCLNSTLDILWKCGHTLRWKEGWGMIFSRFFQFIFDKSAYQPASDIFYLYFLKNIQSLQCMLWRLKKTDRTKKHKLWREHFYSKGPVSDHRSERKVAQNLRVTPVTIQV